MKVIVFGTLSLFLIFSGLAAEVEDFLAPSGSAPVKTEREMLYEQLFDTQLKDLLSIMLKNGRKPKIGGSCSFEVVTGAVVNGTIAQLTDSRLTVQEKYGKVTYAVHVMEQKFWCVYFPKQAARTLVLRKLADERKRKEAEAMKASLTVKASNTKPQKSALEKASAYDDLAFLTKQGDTPKPTIKKRSSTVCKYDTAPASTPDDLKVPLREFGQWIAYRASGMASSIYAKRHADAVAVYVQATPEYQKLDPDSKFMIVESMLNMWGFRCEDHQVSTLDNSHLVIVGNSGKIIGGSSPDAPSNIWVDKK